MKYRLLVLIVSLPLLFCCTEIDVLSNIDKQSKEFLIELGRQNVTRKAHQLTDIQFCPQNQIRANTKVYESGSTYTGMIYSSVKELGSYVGNNVSIYTFMTAINNPRSKIYTDDVGKSPYHGSNSHSYYGTVCSAFVSYVLGLVPSRGSYDFPVDSLFESVDYSQLEDLKIGDVLWQPGHVAVITDVIEDSVSVSKVEVSEAVQGGCVRRFCNEDSFAYLMTEVMDSIYRYKEIYKNTEYVSYPQFVPVFDEVPVDFEYNDDICADKGDAYCYLHGEDVVLNIFNDYSRVEVFRDEEYYQTFPNDSLSDIRLSNLPYGDYSARILRSDGTYSESTTWIVIDYDTSYDTDSNVIYFKSENAVPETFSFVSQSGSRKYSSSELYYHLFTDEEVKQGFAQIPADKIKEDKQYYSITFKTDYGRISLPPQKWCNL